MLLLGAVMRKLNHFGKGVRLRTGHLFFD